MARIFIPVAIHEQESLSVETFQRLNQARSSANDRLLVYVHGTDLKSDFVQLLSGLDLVDFVLTGNVEFEALCSQITTQSQHSILSQK